jgi:N-acyl-phosphatidylethanolamine-hydrolysing phospholipase D
MSSADPVAPPTPSSCSGASSGDDGGFDPRLLDAPHQAGGRYFCPWGRLPIRARDVLRWYRQRPWRRPPERPAPRVEADRTALLRSQPGLSATWVGHATFVLQHERSVLLTDPHFGPRALLPARQVPPGLPVDAIPAAPVALVSHSHYDHLDRWTVRRLPPDTRWRVPLGVGALLRRWGARDVRELDWWDELEEGPWRLTCLPAQHWSDRLSHPRNATLWCGWRIAAAGRTLYFAGDTGWFGGFAELGRRCGPLAAALLPVGAYEPRWFMRYQHLDPPEAVAAFQQLGAELLVGMHWGTFVLTDEPLDEPPRALRAAAAGAGLPAERLWLPAVGERRSL